MVLEVVDIRDVLLLRTNDYKVSKEDLRRKLSEQDVVLKAGTVSVRPLDKVDLVIE